MQVQPINCYPTPRKYNKSKVISKCQQPNFQGIKGTLWGTGIGGGATALGVAAIAGAAALPLFAGYLVVNTLLGACAGHVTEKFFKENKV